MLESKVKRIGGFRVLSELKGGSGSQGTVYRAVCETSPFPTVAEGDIVALKTMVVQDEDGRLFAKLKKRTDELASLDHPNVVRYRGCFNVQSEFNEIHVVVMDCLSGETLKEKLQRYPGGLDADEALRVVDSALAGLEYTASVGLVHRDVKPGNIFLCEDGAVKLIDFEIALQEGGTVTASSNNFIGSFDYMAPDFTDAQFRGDWQSDVFSMGVVMHETLVGRTPYQRFEGGDRQANFAFLSRWTQTGAGHDPIHVSSRIKRILAHADEVLKRALSVPRDQRYADFREFRAGLKTIRFRDLRNGDRAYRLLQVIGKGGFGEVFKARDRKTNELVAIKHLLKASYAERFHREAKIMAQLRDPCFVRLEDFFVLEHGGGKEAFLVMTYLDGMPGSSLRDAIRKQEGKGLPTGDVLRAFARYAHGLAVMHDRGIYHRDIKPANLYYPESHLADSAIMDLGIARNSKGTATTGQVPGTLDYMPPEIVLEKSRGEAGMDVYALGLCLYEALTGKTGYPRLPSGPNAFSAFFERASSLTPPVFDDPLMAEKPELADFLRQMTAPAVANRLTDAQTVERFLLALAVEYALPAAAAPSTDAETVTIDLMSTSAVDAGVEATRGTATMTAGTEAVTMATFAGAMGPEERKQMERLVRKAKGRRIAKVVKAGFFACLLLGGIGAAVFFNWDQIQGLWAPPAPPLPSAPEPEPPPPETPLPRAYTIAYEVGEGVEGSPGPLPATEGVPCKLADSRNVRRQGYRLLGWQNKQNKEQSYSEGATVSNLLKNAGDLVVLVANWATNEYEVVFSEGTNRHRQVFFYDRPANLDSNHFHKLGHSFKHWVRSDSDPRYDGLTYGDCCRVTNLADRGTVKLKAHWKPNEYEIQFLAGADGCQGTMNPMKDIPFTSSVRLDRNSFVRTGYDFDKWTNLQQKCTYDNQVMVERLLETNGVVQLTAQWKPISYMVSLDGKPFTNAVYDVPFELPHPSALAVKEPPGKLFKSWTLGDQSFHPGSVVTNLTAIPNQTIRLDAEWTNRIYTLVFINENGATNNVSGEYGETVEFPTPSRSGDWTFAGWTSKAKGGDPYEAKKYDVEKLVDSLGQDLAFKAQWVEKPKEKPAVPDMPQYTEEQKEEIRKFKANLVDYETNDFNEIMSKLQKWKEMVDNGWYRLDAQDRKTVESLKEAGRRQIESEKKEYEALKAENESGRRLVGGQIIARRESSNVRKRKNDLNNLCNAILDKGKKVQ